MYFPQFQPISLGLSSEGVCVTIVLETTSDEQQGSMEVVKGKLFPSGQKNGIYLRAQGEDLAFCSK